MIYEALARNAEPAATVRDILPAAAHASVGIEIESKSFVIVIRKQGLNSLHGCFRQEPRRKESQFSRLVHVCFGHSAPPGDGDHHLRGWH